MRNLNNDKALAKGRRGSVFMPFLASCCAVLMCASSCNKSGPGDVEKNKVDKPGTHGTGTEDPNVFLPTPKTSGQSSTSAADPTEPYQLVIFNDLKLDLKKDTGNDHYAMQLDGQDITPKTLGKIVLACFTCVNGEDFKPRGIGFKKSADYNATAKKFAQHLHTNIAESEYFKDTEGKFRVYQHGKRKESDVQVKDMVSKYTENVLITLVKNGKLENLEQNDAPTREEKWFQKYVNIQDIDEICTCLGHNVIDTLGNLQAKTVGTKMFGALSPKKVQGKKTQRQDWFHINEVSFNSSNKSPKTTFSYKASGSYKTVSFGFVTIEMIAEDILHRNITENGVLSPDRASGN